MSPPNPGTPRHILTSDDSAKGGKARAAKYAEARAQARELAVERLAGMTDKALARLEALLVADTDADAYRAIKEVLDRVLGRPMQAVEVGGADGTPVSVEVKHSVDDLAAVASILADAGVLAARPEADSAA